MHSSACSTIIFRLTVLCETKWNETKWNKMKWEICSLQNGKFVVCENLGLVMWWNQGDYLHHCKNINICFPCKIHEKNAGIKISAVHQTLSKTILQTADFPFHKLQISDFVLFHFILQSTVLKPYFSSLNQSYYCFLVFLFCIAMNSLWIKNLKSLKTWVFLPILSCIWHVLSLRRHVIF